MKRFKILPVAMSGLLLLGGCGLLPEEETFRAAPVVKTYEKQEFEETLVVRGDLLLTNKITCNYVPTKSENLSFVVGGEFYDAFFVKKGDVVKKGDLLAQLDLSDAQDVIDQCTPQVNQLKMQIAAIEENRKLEIERQKIMMGDASKEALKEALARTNKQFDMQKQPLQDALAVVNLQLEETNKWIRDRQIRAGMDGTVTYVYEPEEYEFSSSGTRVISIADASTSLFRGDTKYWSYLKPGDVYTVAVGTKMYEAVVVSEEELGMEETEKVEGELAEIYLKLKVPAVDLEMQTFGTFELVRDSREDVLMVPKRAVSTTKGQSIVYYQDENGLKAYKKVETGLETDSMIEIVSGLSEGESIIVE